MIGGPLLPKDVLGGKTYAFFNYEAFNFPNLKPLLETSLRRPCNWGC